MCETELCTDRINTVYCLLFTVCVFICSLAKTVDHLYQTLSVANCGPIRRHLGGSPAGIEVPLMTLPGLALSRLGPHRSSEFRQHCHTAALWSVAPPMWRLSSPVRGYYSWVRQAGCVGNPNSGSEGVMSRGCYDPLQRIHVRTAQ